MLRPRDDGQADVFRHTVCQHGTAREECGPGAPRHQRGPWPQWGGRERETQGSCPAEIRDVLLWDE